MSCFSWYGGHGEADAAPKAPSRDRGARQGSRQDEDQREAQREDQVDGFGEEWRRETEARSMERERRVRSVFGGNVSVLLDD